ncbi:MAG: DNA translocase FtsK [Oscillospiraceae bacterium]|nr:DNA translocase FtsK [Oscillospiraceae bacterium]
MARKTTSKKTNTRKKTEKIAPPPPPKKKSGSTAELNDKPVVYGSSILGGVIFLILAICSVISYFNTEGSFVAFFSEWVRGLLGWGFYLAAPAFAISAYLLFTCGGKPVGSRVFATVMLPVIFSALSELMLNTEIRAGTGIWDAVNDLYDLGKVMKSGGVIGGLIANGMNKALSMYGTLPLLVLSFLYCFIVCFWGSLRGLISRITNSHNAYVQYQQETHPIEKAVTANAPAAGAKKPVKIVHTKPDLIDIPLGEEEEELSIGQRVEKAKYGKGTRTVIRTPPKIISGFDENEENLAPPFSGSKSSAAVQKKRETAVQQAIVQEKAPRSSPAVKTTKKSVSDKSEILSESEKIEKEIARNQGGDDYQFPPLSLLRASTSGPADATDEISLNRMRLEEAIQSFGISASVVGVIRGPTVTRYDIELDRGVKLSRVTNLSGDLALSLGVVNVRIAPIPDKISTVGIEVPNKTVSTVFLRDILESNNFCSAKSRLSFALGKDIGGNCIVGNISKLPHLLIAGTTGSGKSVCMNSLILSLLYKARPDEVKLIMIDPKMVELGIYNGIPHLYVPVVTDPKKAAGALQWSVVEMLKRYRAFSEVGVRDLDAFNTIQKKQKLETLPRVVIVIDELADLMLVASKDVEESICRVAQMGRAAGMHLVIATQRPSADVITGLMKANIPSRIAFAVSSALESRIILDQGGAEKLIGFGDMLYSPLGAGKPTRIQGSYVSDEEREEVIRFIKDNNKFENQTNDEIVQAMDDAANKKEKGSGSDDRDSASNGPGGDYDEMLPQAVEVVLEMGSCSVSMLQRRIKLGYSRAARIVDQMEELGVVGPYEGAKPRSVAIDRNGWLELQRKLGYVSEGEFTPDGAIADDYSDISAEETGDDE